MRRNVVFGIIKKEFIQLFRDIRMRIVLFGPPIIMTLVFGYAINTDVKNVRMIVFDEDKTAESRRFIEKFTGSGYFFVIKFVENEKEVDRFFDTGKVDIFIHIKNGFEKRLKQGKAESIQLFVDGTDSSRSSMILASVNNLLQDYLLYYTKRNVAIEIAKRGNAFFSSPSFVEVKERTFFNPELSSRNFYLTGMFGLLISMITIVLTAMSIVKEREYGTIDQLIVSPITPAELVAGKTIPYMIVGFVDTIVISLVIIFWFKVPFNGSFLLLLLSVVIFLLTTTATGLFISTISQTQQQALLSVILFLLPALLFSGFAFPINAMPEVIQLITYFNPMRYFIELTRSIFLKGTGLNILWPKLVALLAIGLALFYFSSRKFAKHLE